MNKIGYIIGREYLVRVRKRTFWLLTFLLPVLYGLLIGFSVMMGRNPGIDDQQVNVFDYSGIFNGKLKDSENLHFLYQKTGEEKTFIELLKKSENQHVLVIPEFNIQENVKVELYSAKLAATFISEKVKAEIRQVVKDERIRSLGLNQEIIQSLDPEVNVVSQKITEAGIEKDNSIAASTIAGIAGFLNYMFVFVYGSLVLRGIHEEKQNRIVEIILSTVKPFELMMGKIIGVALVGLTQFMLWVVLIAGITMIGLPEVIQQSNQMSLPAEAQDILNTLSSINFPLVLGVFVFFFIGGYLLYSSLFAAVAASVDNQADMQQFTVPLSIPLIIAMVSINAVIQAPNSSFSVWMSMIPFTSPVMMVARVPLGVPEYQLIISMLIMVASFIFTTWLAAKIYRIGILVHGSKISYLQLWKWLFYK
ncbi:MAG: ABC transporter permease [Sphingobacteriales bacterium]|nr:ABC transporter permease [Sphingobacteriales bacterium]